MTCSAAHESERCFHLYPSNLCPEQTLGSQNSLIGITAIFYYHDKEMVAVKLLANTQFTSDTPDLVYYAS